MNTNKFFFDTEFIEGFTEPLIGKRRHFIDLISIGIVAEDGSEYYAISNEFDEDDADEWVKKNVIAKLYDKNGNKLNKEHWKSNRQIALDIIKFVYSPIALKYDDGEKYLEDSIKLGLSLDEQIEFYAYFADYDWVLFCSLFGKMINLPKGFPYYCKDLKQMMDDRGLTKEWKDKHCPEPSNEHHALADAKWNKKLYDKIITIKPK